MSNCRYVKMYNVEKKKCQNVERSKNKMSKSRIAKSSMSKKNVEVYITRYNCIQSKQTLHKCQQL